MLNKNCFYSSFNKAYAAQALLMAESLRRVYGNSVDIIAVIVDKLDDNEADYFDVFDSLLFVDELDIPNFNNWIFGLNIVEAATAVKPFALCKLLEKYEHVTYLDPDIMVYSALDEIISPKIESIDMSKQKWGITLTPHQTVAQSEKWLIESTELESLRFGVYNLGFLSVKANSDGKKVAEWWRDRCYHYCVEDVERGLFTDQKLFDNAPALFAGVNVLRHSGYNVATWNLREREVTFENEKLLSNQQPLRFCHFTKATHIGAFAMDRMLNSHNLFEELFYSYLAKMNAKKLELTGLNRAWSYGFYHDGNLISGESRKDFRRLGDSRWGAADPFKN